MSAFKEELVNEINRLRTNPQSYTSTLKDYMTCFRGSSLLFPGATAAIATEEGPQAYSEAIDFLKNQSPREPVAPSKGLCRICEEFIALARQTEDIDAIDMDKIIKKYGSYGGSFSRAVDFGGETPENVVVYLTVCDGDKSRGQRKTLLNPDAKFVGVATGKHSVYGYFSVIITCTKFNNKVDQNDYGLLDAESLAVKVEDVQDNEELPPDVLKIEKQEEIIEENGKKKKVIKIIKFLDDGRKIIETTKVNIDE